MKKNKIVLYISVYTIIAGLLLLGVYTPAVPIKFIEAIIIFAFLISTHALYEKNYELKLLENNFQNQKKLLEDIFKHCPDAIFLKSTDLKYISCNNAFLENIGVNKIEDIIGKKDTDFLPKESAEEVNAHDKEVLTKKISSKYTEEIEISNGEKKVCEINKTPLWKNGKISGILGISRDVSETYELQRKLVEKQAKLTAILDNMPYIAYLKDLNGKILNSNTKFKEELSELGLEKTPYSEELFLEKELEEIKEEDEKIANEKCTIVSERKIPANSGKSWYEIYKAPVFDAENNVSAIVVVAKNIDAEKILEIQKDTFVATLTHDLKTPTTAQIRALKLVLNEHFGTLNESQKEILEQTLNSCKYMFAMISTILSTYKIDSGNSKLTPEKYNIKQLMQSCVDELHYLGKEKGLTILLNSNLEKEDIYADRLEIKRVITNLFANAIAYSAPNSPIDIKLNSNGNEFSIEITNKGKLITDEEIKNLFSKYSSNAHLYRQVGTGLGLYLSKQIIEKHGGKMITKSEEKTGNTFGFIIPQSENRETPVNASLDAIKI